MWEAIINFSILSIISVYMIATFQKRISSEKWLLLFLLLTLVVELFAYFLARKSISNLYLFHLLVPIQTIILSLFFLNIVQRKKFQYYIKTLLGVYLFFVVISTLFLQHITVYNSYTTIFKSVLVIIFSFIYFLDKFQNSTNETVELFRDSIVWIVLGFLVQSLSTFFFEGFMNELISYDSPYALTFYFCNVIVGYITYCLIMAGLLKKDARW